METKVLTDPIVGEVLVEETFDQMPGDEVSENAKRFWTRVQNQAKRNFLIFLHFGGADELQGWMEWIDDDSRRTFLMDYLVNQQHLSEDEAIDEIEESDNLVTCDLINRILDSDKRCNAWAEERDRIRSKEIQNV